MKITVDSLDGHDDYSFTIHEDKHNPGRVFISAPPFASLTEGQAINLINAVADVLEN